MSDDLRDFDELVQRYIEGTLDDEGAKVLHEVLEENPELGEQLVRDLRMETLLRSEVPIVEEEIGRRLAQQVRRAESDRLRRQTELAPVHFWQVRRMAAVAAVLIILAGLFALWLVPSPADQQLTQSEQRRKEIILEQLQSLRQERAALKLPPPVPAPPKVMEEPKPAKPTAVTRAERRRRGEAEEAARFIEARQRFVAQQLRMFERPKALADDLDVEPPETPAPAAASRPAFVVAGPVGRVLETEGGSGAGVLIRQTEEGPSRIPLAKGQTLLSGDRIETSESGETPCASVRLSGGATLDLDRGTAVELLGRDNLCLRGGRLYSNIVTVSPGDSDPESGPPFSVETEAGRFLTYDLQAELYLSSHEVLQKELKARVDRGKVHLMNRKGHVVGRKGQELRSRKDLPPTRGEGFSEPIWRGRERTFDGFPFGRSSPVIFSATQSEYVSTHYAAALALRGEINLAGIQFVRGSPNPGPTLEQLIQDARRLQQFGPRAFPSPVPGAQYPLSMPPSGAFRDTRPQQTPAALQIVARAQEATPSRPVVVVCGGSMTDVACAWLMDRSIAKRVVVVGAPQPSRGTKWSECDPWAAEIVLRYFRCVMVKGVALPIDRARAERITDTRWRSLARQDIKEDPRFRLVYFVCNPDAVSAPKRQAFDGLNDDEARFKPDPKGNILYVIAPREETLLQEFERVFLPPANR